MHANNYTKIIIQTLEDKRRNAMIRDDFYAPDNHRIVQYLEGDLKKYVDSSDVSNMQLITLDYYLRSFISKICTVYTLPPIFKFTDKVSDEDRNRVQSLFEEVGLTRKMAENQRRMKLHNTILAHVKYLKSLDKIYVDNDYSVANTHVIEHPDYAYEWTAICYDTLVEKKLIRVVWDRELGQHYYLDSNKQFPEYIHRVGFIGDKMPIGDNPDLKAPPINPWAVYMQNELDGFWGNSEMDAIVQLVRAVNILLTVSMDDSINETLRLLILNFDPSGTEGESGQIKTGMRHPIFAESSFKGGSDPSALVTSAPLYTKEILELIDKLTDIVSSMKNIDNPIRAHLKEDLSGIALRIKNEPFLREWANDINVMRPSDRQLVKALIETHNYYRPNRMISENVVDEISIDYQAPSITTDEEMEYELERKKWEDGTSSPVLYVMAQNPEFTEGDARNYLQKNIADYNNLTGIGALDISVQTEDQIINED